MTQPTDEERKRFEAWCAQDRASYMPTDDGVRNRRDWKVWQAAGSPPAQTPNPQLLKAYELRFLRAAEWVSRNDLRADLDSRSDCSSARDRCIARLHGQEAEMNEPKPLMRCDLCKAVDYEDDVIGCKRCGFDEMRPIASVAAPLAEGEASRLKQMVSKGSWSSASDKAEALNVASEWADLEDVLRRNGFVRCDIMACNCGSWHARYGLPERWAEIKEALAGAGHPLCNENGNLVRNALAALIAERDALAALPAATPAAQAAPLAGCLGDIGECNYNGACMYQCQGEQPFARVASPATPAAHAGVGEHHGLDNDEQVLFYEQDFYVLSNFSSFTLEWKGIRFDTSEAAYHCEKFVGKPAVMTAIQHAPSAHEAFKIAEHYKPFRRTDWDAVKVSIMREILRAKADQHEYVRRKLIATGARTLIENSWRDDYWGWGPNRDGQNMLGKLWMEIRASLPPQPKEKP